MTLEVENVFKAETKSSFVLLAQGGNGFYVPAYQRDYSWGKKEIGRLIDDTLQGLAQLFRSEDSITFIGSIILIRDNRHETINPLVKGHVPGGVLLVIDGQQRLTTLLMLNLVLHNEIEVRAKDLAKDASAIAEWVKEQKQQILAKIRSTFEIDFNVGDDTFRYYPKMIRAFDDSWSWQVTKAAYASPVARIIRDYIQHHRDKPGARFTPKTGEQRNLLIEKAIAVIARRIKRIAEGALGVEDEDDDDETGLDFLSASRFKASADMLQSFLNTDLRDDVRELFDAQSGDKKTKSALELFRLFVFARYVLDRVAVTSVVASNEDYAFDVFESLNTTGTPLTAIETFKPQVVNVEGLSTFEKSPAYACFREIDSFSEAYSEHPKKLAATNRLLIAFALLERGEKLSKHLSIQRRFLRKHFEKLQTPNERNEFLQGWRTLQCF
jgi:hypothetical protein